MSSVSSPVAESDLPLRLARTAEAIERLLESLLATAPGEGEIARPERLVAAMRHGALAGGKRVDAVEDVVSVGQKIQVQIA